MIRWTTTVLIVGSLLAGVLYDRVEHSDQPEVAEAAPRIVTPAMSETPPLTSDWYCPIGSTSAEGYASHTIHVTNLSDEPAFATLETLTESGAGPSLQFDLAPLVTETVDLATIVDAEMVSAVVEITGGEGVVAHEVITATGVAEGTCSTETSDQWFFGGGSTSRDSKYYLALMNPSLNSVVFEATFQTESRLRQPKDLQAAVVPPLSVRVIEVTEVMAREPVVSAQISTVQGHLVVERLQMFDGVLGPMGTTLQLGVADPAENWTFASGTIVDRNDNTISIHNPGEETAEIDLYLDPLDPADRVSYGLLPREISLAPGHTTQLDLRSIALEIGIVLPYDLGVRLVSANGVPFVADRWQLSPAIDQSLIGAGGQDAKMSSARLQDGDTGEIPEEEVVEVESSGLPTQSIPTQGVASSHGIETVATRWVIPWVTIEPNGGTALVIRAGEAGASVEARLLVAGEWQPPLRAVLEADGRLVLPIDSAALGAPILVVSTEPVTVEAQVIVPRERHEIIPGIPTVTD